MKLQLIIPFSNQSTTTGSNKRNLFAIIGLSQNLKIIHLFIQRKKAGFIKRVILLKTDYRIQKC